MVFAHRRSELLEGYLWVCWNGLQKETEGIHSKRLAFVYCFIHT